ncbi:MAG: DMT family transporter [Candidatus Heimdallarchaeum aukensis]|uniref:DMT family transporter n=1 Tax=Candidatus Heimdallarchaeum aukensis TaxID=2876573 RepID=A0A9Y1BMU0_9ARCH|nr:MAG: DMT family transporter [Candidatus Heimdallarchaeum aukensis]
MDKKTNFSYLASITAGLFFGSIPVISAILRDLNVSSIEQSLLRIFFGSIFGLGIIVFYTLKKNKEQVKNSIKLTNQKTYLLQSLIFVMMIVVYLSSIAVGTPAGEAALLIQIHPFITLILGRIFLKERITKSKILAIIVATAGLITLTEVWKWESFMSSIVGTTLAILNGLFYAFYLLVGRASAEKRKNVPYSLSIAWVISWAIIIALPLLIMFSILPLPEELAKMEIENIMKTKIILIGIGFALAGSVIPYGLLMISAKYQESSKSSLLLLDEPVFAIILGAIILKEPITLSYILGGIGIIAGVIIIILDKSKKIEEKEIETERTNKIKTKNRAKDEAKKEK